MQGKPELSNILLTVVDVFVMLAKNPDSVQVQLEPAIPAFLSEQDKKIHQAGARMLSRILG